MSALVFTPATYSDIEWALMNDRHARNTVMPRFTPLHWWECDVCEISKAGYMREYEIKTSRADFKVDAQKSRRAGWGTPNPNLVETKHGLLAMGDPRGPAAFYFVTPAGLLKPEEIPLWAGLIEIVCHSGHNYPLEKVITKAPRLHKEKANPKIALWMRDAAYGRLHHQWSADYHKLRSRRLGFGVMERGSGI